MRQSVRRLFTVGHDQEPLWVRLHVQPIGNRWAAMLLADAEPPPEPGALKGLAFFGQSAKEAEQQAKGCLAMSEPLK